MSKLVLDESLISHRIEEQFLVQRLLLVALEVLREDQFEGLARLLIRGLELDPVFQVGRVCRLVRLNRYVCSTSALCRYRSLLQKQCVSGLLDLLQGRILIEFESPIAGGWLELF